jgi:glycosyltransferase involved in cell wall biosynthesis
MKIAVYCIALNEEQFVDSWYNSAKDADYLLIADTGSTDGTVEKARALGINVFNVGIKPWRFDTARNVAVSLIPTDIDYCIALDMDEVLTEGWREHLERAEPGVTRPRYKYTWNWKEDGSPGLQYSGDKIHSRQGYIWKHPVHEVMYGDRIQEMTGWVDLEIHHHADNTKTRSSYLPLLEVSVKEDPYNDRNAFYYGRELFFYGQYEKATEELKRYLTISTWNAERSWAMRYLSQMSLDFDQKINWLKSSIAESPERREPYVDLAELYYLNNMWRECLDVCESALNIRVKPLEYLCEDKAWGETPYDYAAIAAYNLKDPKCIKYAEKAIELNPNDERLKLNLQFCLDAFPA